MLAIELHNVSKVYGAVRALAGVSCRFEGGAATVVRGPNGSGKSTLLAVVGTLTRPSSGHVEARGLGRGRQAVRGSLGWVGHESLCYPDLSGRENIELAARLHGCDAGEAFRRAAERFQIGAFAHRPLRTYSRGQRQRVALARALVHEPALVLLDEPTTGLDAAAVERLATVVREEVARGAAVILVTHDPTFADAMGGAGIALERGRLVTPAVGGR